MYTLQPSSATATGRLFIVIFAAFWMTFSLFWEIVVLLNTPMPLKLVMGLFGLPFVAIGLGMCWWCIRPMVAAMRVARPSVSVSSSSLRVGDRVVCAYQQQFRSDVQVDKISIDFVMRETATYRRGTDTTTETHEQLAERAEFANQSYSAGQVFSDQRTFQVPNNAMHSFDAPNNKIRWLIKVHVQVAHWPDVSEEYELKVLPERGR